MADKIDSNDVELRFAVEPEDGTIDANTVWHPLEPNSFGSFGPTITRVARQPITKGRRRKKGTPTGIDVVAEDLEFDLTPNSLERFLSPILFTDPDEKATTKPLYGTAITITGVTAADDTYAAASGLSVFLANDLIEAKNFSETANNGLKTVVSSNATGVVVAEALADETPSDNASLTVVGHKFGAGTVGVEAGSGYPKLIRNSGTKSFIDLGLTPGSWIYVGGDTTGSRFAVGNNNGFKRVKSVTATEIEIDKSVASMGPDDGSGKTIEIYLATEWMDKGVPSRKLTQFERQVGSDNDGVMSEYVTRALPEDFEISIPLEDKVVFTVGFIGSQYDARSGAEGLKDGERPTLNSAEETAFNTTNNVPLYSMYIIEDGNTSPTPLFGYVTEMTLTIGNNLDPNKAIGVYGAFDLTAGILEVGASITAYFTTIEAVKIMKTNPDITLHTALVADNCGYLFDLPLVGTSSDNGLDIELNRPITLALTSEAYENSAGYTMGIFKFPYLPDVAAGN